MGRSCSFKAFFLFNIGRFYIQYLRDLISLQGYLYNISFQNINNNDDRAYYVEFLTEDINGEDSLMFWIG